MAHSKKKHTTQAQTVPQKVTGQAQTVERGEVSLCFPDALNGKGVTITGKSKSECRRLYEQQYGKKSQGDVKSNQTSAESND